MLKYDVDKNGTIAYDRFVDSIDRAKNTPQAMENLFFKGFDKGLLFAYTSSKTCKNAKIASIPTR